MALLTRDQACTLQYSSNGSPWARVHTKTGQITNTIERSLDGSPWNGVEVPATGGGGTWNGIPWSDIGGVDGVPIGDINEVDGQII